MTNENQEPMEGLSCSCCKGVWIWVILAVAIVGVLIAKKRQRPEADAEKTTPETAKVEAVAGKPITPGPTTQGKTLPRLVDLGAGKCIPCKMMAPILEDLKKTYTGKLDVQFIDVWENPEAGQKYGINVIPTQIFYDAAGKERFRHEGFLGKEDIMAKWKEFGVDLNQ